MQQKYTVLVIDDDRTELNIMITVLSSAGLRVLVAEDGETGFHRAMFARPDLILLDVVMPGFDGYETCMMLRENKRTKDIPIFFKTCLGGIQTFIEGFMTEIDDFVAKPCNHDDLLRKIRFRLAAIQREYLQPRSHAIVCPLLLGFPESLAFLQATNC